MKPLTTILTGTYNKHEFLAGAAESIFKQTSGDWRWWLVLDGANKETTELAHGFADKDPRVVLFTEEVPDGERYKLYRPAMLLNKYFPLISTKYLCWHSDDDLLEPCFVEVLVRALEDNPGYHVSYGTEEKYNQQGNSWQLVATYPSNREMRFGPGSPHQPLCVIDGGQVIQTKASWDMLEWKFPTEYGPHREIDGHYLNALATKFHFLFVDKRVQIGRATYLSENSRGSR